MTTSDGNRSVRTGHPEGEYPSGPERDYLCRLLDDLAAQDPAAHEALLAADPGIIECAAGAEVRWERLRAALTGQAGVQLSAEQARVIADTAQAWAQRRPVVEEQTGVLTSLTRHLPPHKAVQLYRKIAPVFVYQVLGRVNESASIRVVNQIVDHLCSDEVQQRLRTRAHVRQGILDEFRAVLGRSDLHQELSLADLERVLEECGAMNDLLAMENCIRLTAARAG
jgi:hypothetical protein